MNRIYSINQFLKDTFGEKVIKLSLDGNFTCPNRDGSKGFGGCTFCSEKGSGDMASDIPSQIELLSKKWPKAKKFIAYFQNYSGTYKNVDELRKLYYNALSAPNIIGIAIATRPDCINDEILELLYEINQKYFLWVEFGLQTIRDDIAEEINRCYPLTIYEDTIAKLNSKNIRYVTHLILGLPGETRMDMVNSLNYICAPERNLFGIKLHMLNITRGSKLAITHPTYCEFSSIDDYISFICDLIEIIPSNITIHRLNGDVPRKLLLTPEWSYMKRTILNGITKELAHRNTYQGKYYENTKEED